VTFALLLLAIWGRAWAESPSIGRALVVGIGTIVAPWFVMQLAMGVGIAASRSPNPSATRLRNLATHAVYAFGLYAAAVAISFLVP
jgi:hypothetical protein